MAGDEYTTVKATYAYSAANADELTFNVGDLMYVSDMSDANWWVGFLGDVEGLIPASYVEIVEEAAPAKPAVTSSAPGGRPAWNRGGGAAAGGGGGRSFTPATTSAMAVTSGAAKEGFMKKQGKLRSKWVQRWFKLEGSCLVNGKDQFATNTKSWLLDRSSSVRIMRHHDPTKPPVLEVRNPNSTGQKLRYFQVTSEQEAQEWEAAIRSAIG
ncbi:uncharacterized protein AMSG_06644 [Thecamonas trahens ATCC 50062]|uniref:Uncharacterized protein n=1 Tax=Thecamonas trahens ATCC 50062 TaxID=461836 RepID=A0A0L0DEM6_THETB|nr:hypothetical protein AMSG_06644 [Thecamonas trahens ATCC 50062]KNC50754.1 hypothetical protein AMSG_06644 [Thecamonas trahens ATCC 50062]|eukprot:XP_013756717.1 hypothetical protein AMSG_06644 [Thecamonas trahens ATCC 50062]